MVVINKWQDFNVVQIGSIIILEIKQIGLPQYGRPILYN